VMLTADEEVFRSPEEEEVAQQQAAPKKLVAQYAKVKCPVDLAEQARRQRLLFDDWVSEPADSAKENCVTCVHARVISCCVPMEPAHSAKLTANCRVRVALTPSVHAELPEVDCEGAKLSSV